MTSTSTRNTPVKANAVSFLPETSSIVRLPVVKRDLDSFKYLTEPEFLGRAPKLGQMIAINSPTDRVTGGFFLQKDYLVACGWKAAVSDLEPGSFKAPHAQKLGGEMRDGIIFSKPRLQVLFETAPLLEKKETIKTKEGTQRRSTIIGSMNPADNVDDPGRVNYLWDTYKDDPINHTLRTWYSVFVLSSSGQRCHDLPLLLSIKGATGGTFSAQLKEFRDNMAKTIAVATSTPKRPQNYDAYAQFVFQPLLELTEVGRGNDTSDATTAVAATQPVYDMGPEAAQLSLNDLIIPENLMKQTQDERHDEFAISTMCRYSNEYSSVLNIAPGVQITPMGIEPKFEQETIEVSAMTAASEVHALPSSSVPKDDYGADASFE